MKRVLAVMLAAGFVVGCRQETRRTMEPPARDVVQPAPSTRQADAPAPQPPIAPVEVAAPKPSAPPSPAPAAVTPPAALPPAAPQPQAIATVDGVEISRQRIVDLLMDSHGLNMLLRVVQVELAKSLTAKESLAVTPAEIAQERETTLFRMAKEANQELLDKITDAEKAGNQAAAEKLREQFKSDAELMLQQALARENMTSGEFALLIEANTYLRKYVEKQLAGKITEENVREAYLNLYGENVRVRHIQLANTAEVTDAQAKLRAGVPFQQVAKEMSRNAATRALGGELLPFSRDTQGLPDSFKQVAFSLKTPGEISEPVEANGSYHLLQLVQSIPPKAVKFEDVKDSVREQLYDRWVTERMKALRESLARKAMESLKIQDPALARQFQDRINKRDSEVQQREQIARELARQREAQGREFLQATSRPSGEAATTQSTTAPAILPTPATEKLRPPATTSGSDTPDQTPSTSPAK